MKKFQDLSTSLVQSILWHILQCSSDIIIGLGRDFTITTLNKKGEEFFGWSSKKAQGKNLIELCRKESFSCPITENFFEHPTSFNINSDSINASGKICNLNWNIIPINIEAKVAGVLLLGKDVEIKKNNIAYYLTGIMEAIPGCLYWKNIDRIYLGCNKLTATLAGLSSPYEVIGKTDKELWGEQAPSLALNDAKVISEGKTLLVEEELKAADGRWVYFTGVKMPLRDENNKIIGIIGNSLDITELKKTQEELKAAKEKAESANQAKSEFLANMGHDLRTPLTGIIGFSQILKDEIQNPERREYARMLYESSCQLLELFNSILDLIEVDQLHENDLAQQSFEIRELMSELMALEMPAIKAKNLEMSVQVDDTVPPYLISDKMKLKRVLLNLIGNALKFTEKGSVTLGVALEAPIQNGMAKVIFSIKDTGIGIDKELQTKVFERFFKVTPSYKGVYKGYGLGLNIVQKYVGLLGGMVNLDSEVGVGTTFSLKLSLPIGQKPIIQEGIIKIAEKAITTIEEPAREETTTTQSVISPNNSLHTPLSKNKLQVLLVEDNAMALAVLKTLVSKFDVQISTATDAEHAYELVKAQSFDLLITDLGLPDQQGTELSKMIRRLEHKEMRKPLMKIVALTGHDIEEVSKSCLECGINEVFRKPMKIEVLENLLKPLIHAKTSKHEEDKAVLEGSDLPNTEAELFQIGQYQLFDLSLALATLGSEEFVRDIFKNFKKDGVDPDLPTLKLAHEKHDWQTIENLAHKMKGGATYGTTRLYYALLYMERYLKAGYSKCSELLYQQMIKTIEETVAYLENEQQ
jgi:two-component system aerobic respiration control sensor histidine kinase ArcB